MIALIVGDLHVGSTMALWPQGAKLQDGGEYTCNAFQTWLNDCWWSMLETALALPEKPIVIVNGDIIQGAHDRDGQLVTSRTDVQADAAYEALKPLREIAARMYMMHGTPWHGGAASRDVTALAKRLDVVPNPATKGPLWWELYLNMAGHVVHVTHHVSATSLPFYEATAPLRDFYVLTSELHRTYGKDAPAVELDVRSHRHRCIHVHKPPHVNVLVVPAWQLKGEFAFKVASSSLPDIGYGLIEATPDGLIVKPVVFQLPAVHVEE